MACTRLNCRLSIKPLAPKPNGGDNSPRLETVLMDDYHQRDDAIWRMLFLL